MYAAGIHASLAIVYLLRREPEYSLVAILVVDIFRLDITSSKREPELVFWDHRMLCI